MSKHVKPADNYSPLYFLASLGAGGLAVTFFMYLFFWVPHKGRAVPVFEDITAAWIAGGGMAKFAIALAVLGIAVFAFLNVKSLIWNYSAIGVFKKTDTFEKLCNSNAKTTLLAQPLATAMTVNAMFIVGLVFVPNLWSVIEYLFPLALITFTLLGIWTFRTIGAFLGRILTKGGIFDVTANNSFAQLLPAFAIAMIAVGMAAPAAMSSNPTTVAVSLTLSTFFGMASILYTIIAAITAFSSMLHYGTAREAGPTLMVVVPIITTLGIMFLRQDHGMHTTFKGHSTAIDTMIFLGRLLAIQIVFILLGMLVLLRQEYFKSFVFGNETSPGSYALVCLGVALSVMIHFFANKGLVATGMIDKYSVVYWIVTAIAIAIQFTMIWLVFRLNRQHFGKYQLTAETIPAE